MKNQSILTPDNIESTYPIQIYTDSSLKNINGISYVSYGYIIESYMYNLKEENYFISEGTISFGEMSAILSALIKIEEFISRNIISNNTNIILFSDSEYSVKSLNEWIFKWFNNRSGYNYLKSDGNKVAHQTLIDSIIRIIINNNIKIKIYHTYGHINDYEKLRELKLRFNKSGLKMNTQLVKQISNYNTVVDCNSRLNFKNYNGNVLKSLFIIEDFINNKDIKKYKKLINKKNI